MTTASAAKPASGTAPAPILVLKSSEFRKGREEGWRDLEGLIGRIEKRGVRYLSIDELQRLPLLYRSALSSLSVARSIALDRNLLRYLENLVFRAYIAVYGPRTGVLESVGEFLRRGFPRSVRAARWHLLVASLAFLVGTIAGYALTLQDEAWFSSMVPSSLAGDRGPRSTRAGLLGDEIFAPFPGIGRAFGLMASFLFSNNTTVGILIFTLGFAAGIPSLLLLAYQGLILGAFVALHASRGLTIEFLGWLSIHGVTEISAILLCGAAGLMLADKVLFPGRYSRLDSVAQNGREAALIGVGAIIMLFVAAILEGGFRQLVQSTELRFAIGGFTGALWLAYLGLAGRGERR
jgi:uncharacterized membrane protein SpoIIM required for sporulation